MSLDAFTKETHNGTEYDIQVLESIQRDLANLVQLQDDPLLRIEDNLENAMINFEEAQKNHRDIRRMRFKQIMGASAIGALSMTPLTFILGVKIGVSMMASGAIFGGVLKSI